jgi:hypothetical protein
VQTEASDINKHMQEPRSFGLGTRVKALCDDASGERAGAGSGSPARLSFSHETARMRGGCGDWWVCGLVYGCMVVRL